VTLLPACVWADDASSYVEFDRSWHCGRRVRQSGEAMDDRVVAYDDPACSEKRSSAGKPPTDGPDVHT